MNGHVSPRLGVRFEMGDGGLRILRPDGSPFLTYQELADDRRAADRRAEQEHSRAEQERLRAEQALRELEELRQRLRPPEPGGGA